MTPLPVNQVVGVWVGPDFAGVINTLAEKSGMTFSEQLLHLAVMGAEHERICVKTNDHRRTGKK